MTAGIICEFNPFHKGHKYLIDTVKKECENVICVMSGNVVQRGEFAIYDKFTRAKMALENGTDLIIDLPCAYSLMSAEGFAKYAVQILEKCGIADKIAFGAECEDTSVLKEIAVRIDNSKQEIINEMKQGISYPAARKNVIKSDILDYPNNILAVEYIRHTNLPFTAVKRIGKGHDTDDELYSASAIRSTLNTNEICTLKNCERAVLAKLRSMTAKDFLQIEDVTEGLENRIVQAVKTAENLQELYDSIKTKRYAHSRIRRIILKSYLSVTKEFSCDVPYIRIIGFNEKGRELLTEMKSKATLPVISKYSDIKKLDEKGQRLFKLECRCTDLYNLGFSVPKPCGLEQKSHIVIAD